MLELAPCILVFQEGEYFVAYCPSLNLSSCGDSIEEAKSGLDEVVTAYLKNYRENNSLHDDLMKHDWTFASQKTTPTAAFELDIPSGLLRRQFPNILSGGN